MKITTIELNATSTELQKSSKKQIEVIAKVSKQCDDSKDLRKMMKMLMEQKDIMYNDANNASTEQNSGLEDEESATESEPLSTSEDEASESETDSILNSSRHYWAKGVKMPMFEGENPLGWITCAENFFAVQHVQQSTKVRLIFITMEGNALHWFQYWRHKTKRKSWSIFKAVLIKVLWRYQKGDIYECLATLS